MSDTAVNAKTPKQAAIFVGHGDPMMALREDSIAQSLHAVGTRLAQMQPKALLVISAHWYTRTTLVQSALHPKQIYDMYGFPDELYQLEYHPEGNTQLTQRVQELLGNDVAIDDSWGIDHGAWAPLHHLVPAADIPVVMLSTARGKDAQYAFELGKRLAPLRDEGYAIIGSGNIVHNLRTTDWQNPGGTPQATEFNDAIRTAILQGNTGQLIDFHSLPFARYAVPTSDHYLPLLTVIGSAIGEKPEVFNDVLNLGSISMTSYAFGLEG